MSIVEHAIADFFSLAKSHRIMVSHIARASSISRVTLSNWKNKRNEPTLGAWLLANDALDRLIEQKLKA